MQKLFSGGVKEWLLIVLGAALLLFVLFFPLRYALAASLTAEEQQLMDAYQTGEIIRIHIISNSDLPKDQQIKLKVRDAIIEVFGRMMADAGKNSCEEAYAFLQQHTEEMQAIAQECCAQNGFDGSVTAETGTLSLPSKQYGHVLLPEGEYRALRITLGEGKGQNWWCVLYPQLCLALSSVDSANASLFWQSKQIFAHWLLIEQ